MALFGVSVSFLLGFIYLSTAAYMEDQTEATIEAEIRGLAERYRLTSLKGLVQSIDERIERQPFSSTIYLLTNQSFAHVAGNLNGWPQSKPDPEGWVDFKLEQVGHESPVHVARARAFLLAGDFHLLVGRDMFELRATQALIARTLAWGLAITAMLALCGAVMMSRSTARRLEAINAISRRIMRGDLSQRVPSRGTHDEFDRLAASLNDMLDQIQRLMDGVRHVSDNIAHDLRTPLTRLRNRLETLSHSCETDQDEAEHALAEADAMLATFNALLRIARIEAGARREAFSDVSLRGVIEDAAELYEALAEDNGQRFELQIDANPSVLGDRDLLFQAIANLLDNAIKYTPVNGRIELRLQGDDTHAHITVTDSGPGIASKDHDRVLERFVRLEDSRSTPGNGLGLSLVAAVARLHGADISFADANPGLIVELRLGPSA
ncbi:MAG: signal transduction histidine kinase [Gammaproteobacteria bacterium]|jgi:signal transduction histidine kinase